MVLDKDRDLIFPNVLIIEGSAGTGKTHTLAQRYVQYLLSKKIPHNDLANILAITFTNNAAREMKQRILDWLKKLALGIDCEERRQTQALVDLSPEQLTNRARLTIDNILKCWSDFHIQTIDSFMNRILRASAYEMGMPLEVEITESYELLTDSALGIVLKELGDKIPLKELERFLHLLNQESDTYLWNPIPKITKTFKEFLKEEGKVLEKILFEENFDKIKEHFARITEIYQRVVDLGSADKVKTNLQQAVKEQDIKGLISGYDMASLWFDKRKSLDDKNKNVKEACKDLSKIVGELTELYSNSNYFHYGLFYEHFKKALNNEKRRNEIIHFDDINKTVSDYLRKGNNVPEIYYHLGDTLYHFLLDEFQDTDRVQWENIQPLLCEAYAKGGSFFAVGDLKQAIYLFRKADYRIMRRMVQEIRSKSRYGSSYLPPSVIDNARVVSLEENFRSGKVIVAYVADIFKNRLKELQKEILLLKEDRTGLTDYLQTTKKEKQGYVKTIVIKRGDDEPEKGVLFEILSDVRKRYHARDITILARKNGDIERIVEWLTEAGVETASFSSLNIKKRKIIMELIALLQFLDAPVDNLSFATFISGDIFLRAVKSRVKEINREEILTFILNAPKRKNLLENLYTYFRESLEFCSLWELFFEDLFNKVGYLPLYDLVCEIFRRFEIFNNFKEETGFLTRFLEAISITEARGMNNIKDFIELLTAESEESLFNVILPDYIDAVKVMTFHKAKGLGFPVVINLIYDEKGKATNIFFVKENEDLRIYYIKKDFLDKSLKLKRIYDEQQQDELIQDLNLLYVANTRAMNELYNIVIKRDDQYHNSCLAIFEEFEAGEKLALLEERGIRPEATQIEIPKERAIEFIDKEKKGWSISRLRETKKGEFFHEILACIRFAFEDPDKELTEIIKQVSGRTKEVYDLKQVKRTIMEFLNTDGIREWFEKRPGRQIQQEVEYINAEGLLYRLDRVVIDPGIITIIDFKTGTEEFEDYSTQLKDYIKTLAQLSPKAEVKGYLAFIETKKIVEIK